MAPLCQRTGRLTSYVLIRVRWHFHTAVQERSGKTCRSDCSNSDCELSLQEELSRPRTECIAVLSVALALQTAKLFSFSVCQVLVSVLVCFGFVGVFFSIVLPGLDSLNMKGHQEPGLSLVFSSLSTRTAEHARFRSSVDCLASAFPLCLFFQSKGCRQTWNSALGEALSIATAIA